MSHSGDGFAKFFDKCVPVIRSAFSARAHVRANEGGDAVFDFRGIGKLFIRPEAFGAVEIAEAGEERRAEVLGIFLGTIAVDLE